MGKRFRDQSLANGRTSDFQPGRPARISRGEYGPATRGRLAVPLLHSAPSAQRANSEYWFWAAPELALSKQKISRSSPRWPLSSPLPSRTRVLLAKSSSFEKRCGRTEVTWKGNPILRLTSRKLLVRVRLF